MDILIVEDDRRYREGLVTLLSYTPGHTVVAQYADGADAVQACTGKDARHPPADLVLMDLEMPRMDGITATRRLKAHWPSIKVVVLTVFEEPTTIVSAICAGADGYLLKTASAKELLTQIALVGRGGAPMTPGVASTVLDLLRASHAPQASVPTRLDLTPREQEVLRCLVDGASYKQVADQLSITLDTVRSHIRKLYRKLQVHSVAEAVTLAIRQQLV